jgi:hypothetical protein
MTFDDIESAVWIEFHQSIECVRESVMYTIDSTKSIDLAK